MSDHETPPASSDAYTPIITPEWVETALRDALRRDLVPFVVIVPLSREVLRQENDHVFTYAGEQAAKALLDQIQAYRREVLEQDIRGLKDAVENDWGRFDPKHYPEGSHGNDTP